MTEPAHSTPDELREQAETELDGVLGGSFAERTQRLIDELDRINDGPSVQECARHDALWWGGEKGGER